MRKLFTSESVTEGHPDKLCDQIADAVLDAVIRKKPDARVACEVFATTGVVFVMGEVSDGALDGIDIEQIVRETIRQIGYSDYRFGFHADTVAVITSIHAQSPDIAQGVTKALEVRESKIQELGAGDQGMVFGYASDETDELMPMPIYLAHALTRKLAMVRKQGVVSYLGPDGKAQVSVEYEDDKPVRVDNIVISAQHLPEIEHDTIEKDIIEQVIRKVIPEQLIDTDTKFFINPTGRFVIGGPQGDTGLTGRKIVVDTYGGFARHGGGAFSGKDPTKVDRSAAYAARYVAKNLVAAGVAKSQKQNAENKQKFQNTKLDESFDAFDINQACDYIQDSYLEFRSLYLEQYERTGGNIDIKSLFSSVLRSGNQDMHKYCEFLFEKIGFIV